MQAGSGPIPGSETIPSTPPPGLCRQGLDLLRSVQAVLGQSIVVKLTSFHDTT